MSDAAPSTLPERNTVLQSWLRAATPILLAFAGSFVIGGIMIAISGDNPFQAYGAILKGAVGDSYNIAATLSKALPIVGAGICAALAFKAGLLNIGGEGQIVLGGLGAILVALYFPTPGFLALSLALLAALLAGGVWALMTGWFETQFRVPILVSSLLLNFLATGFVSYMVNFPLLEPGGARSQSAMINEASRLPRLFAGTQLSAGLFLIIAIVILATFVLRRTSDGYELRLFGANPAFAEASGINPVRLTLITMFFSGAVAGITGAIQVLGVHYRLIDGALVGPGFAWTGVMAAILANNNPIGVVVAGLFFAAVQTGAAGMERATSVPAELSFVVQAIMILFIASREALHGQRRADR
jgi:ABC-type uncharacterized transport system permease subunit